MQRAAHADVKMAEGIQHIMHLARKVTMHQERVLSNDTGDESHKDTRTYSPRTCASRVQREGVQVRTKHSEQASRMPLNRCELTRNAGTASMTLSDAGISETMAAACCPSMLTKTGMLGNKSGRDLGRSVVSGWELKDVPNALKWTFSGSELLAVVSTIALRRFSHATVISSSPCKPRSLRWSRRHLASGPAPLWSSTTATSMDKFAVKDGFARPQAIACSLTIITLGGNIVVAGRQAEKAGCRPHVSRGNGLAWMIVCMFAFNRDNAHNCCT